MTENALTTSDDIEQAAARLTAALEAQTEPEPEKEYAVTAGKADGAEITVPEKSKAGETVTIKVNVTDSDKEIDTVTVTGASGAAEVTKTGESEYTFIMPEEDVNVTVSLKDKAADKTALDQKIKEAEALKESDYTSATWKAFRDALNTAKLVSADTDADQAEVDVALKNLENAANGLKPVQQEIEKPDQPDTADKAVETGDTFGNGWICLMLLSGAALAVITVNRKKKNLC